MKINLTTRHFLDGDNSYEPYKNLIGRFKDACDIIKEFNFPIEINLDVSTLDGLLSDRKSVV